jgi:cell fate regulator YaaT (PSP1 superfamily)
MKLVAVEVTFDNFKTIFYYTAEDRVDFRLLVKELVSRFRTRSEMRQIGVRQESLMLGGIGVCGRPYCCSGFMCNFNPVSVKMAKEQNISLKYCQN